MRLALRPKHLLAAAIFLALASSACGGGSEPAPTPTDAGVASREDTGAPSREDVGTMDAPAADREPSVEPDGSTPTRDSEATDASDRPDSTAFDSGDRTDATNPIDSGRADAARPDSGARDASSPDAGPDACRAGEAYCTAHDHRRFCSNGAWADEACAPNSGCVRGQCVAAACSDECNLGDRMGARTCQLVDLAMGHAIPTDAVHSMHDRSREYERWLRRDGLAAGGGVGSAHYADPPAYMQIDGMNGIGDSAIWTGTYLAAEALRLMATGAADARANVIRLAGTLHLFFKVSGSPGMLARFAIPSAMHPSFPIGDLNCMAERTHCGVMYQGLSYDYIGHISRDQYQGVILGYALAFEALTSDDEPTRAIIRADVVELVQELMRERMVRVQLTINGTRLPPSNATVRFIVLNPAEMSSGALDLRVNTADVGAAEMYGFQEFAPDLADLVRQLPLLGWVPSIPRASSAIMLASFFRVAFRVTENDPRFAQDHNAILSYYTSHMGTGGNINDWLAIARQWSASSNCGGGYFANNITMEPLYNLARLEDDPARRTLILHDLFETRMWPAFATTKNSFFSFIFAGVEAAADPAIAASAARQLGQFPPPPRVRHPVDLRQDPRYMPHDSRCADQVDHATAVDVGDRVVGDFIWQRDPWSLLDGGDLAQTEPGVDYLVAYWLGRKHGFIDEDAAGRCLIWR